jgi:hypothetical protein
VAVNVDTPMSSTTFRRAPRALWALRFSTGSRHRLLFSPLGVLLGLVAVILGILGIVRVNRGQADNRGQAVAGLVTGALALVVGLFFAVGIGTFFATNVNDFRQFGRCMDNARSDQPRQACAEQLSRDLER